MLARDEVAATRHRERRPGTTAAWPQWLSAEAVDRLREAGFPEPWRHQVEVAESLFRGTHTAVCNYLSTSLLDNINQAFCCLSIGQKIIND